MLTPEHRIILQQLKDAGGKMLTADDLQQLTNIEPIRISAILADLTAHALLLQSKSNDRGGYWLYSLSEAGRKFLAEDPQHARLDMPSPCDKQER